MTDEKYESLCRAVRSYVSEKRFAHTLRVYRECRYFCESFEMTEEEKEALLTAALLHDIAKYVSREEQEALCARHGIDTTGTTDSTVHELGGAALSRELFGRETVNEPVFSAILSHATGRPHMTLTDELLCLADYTEEGRTFSACLAMREYLHGECERLKKENRKAGRPLADEAMRRYIDGTAEYLRREGKEIDPRMTLARETL